MRSAKLLDLSIIMKKKIDDIFKNSEHQKSLDVRPELWDRLERQLDEDVVVNSGFRPWIVAASIVLVTTLSALLYLNIDNYEVEDLSVEIEPNFSKEETAGLEQVYWIEPSIFLNPSYM